MGDLKCPVNPEHKGINAIVQSEASPHYAGAWCAAKNCGQWIKWMNSAQYDDFRAVENGQVSNGRKDRVPLRNPVPPRPGKKASGFRVILDSGYEDDERRELTDSEVEAARFLMDHTGALVRDESYIGEDGEIVHYLRHPKDVRIVPR